MHPVTFIQTLARVFRFHLLRPVFVLGLSGLCGLVNPTFGHRPGSPTASGLVVGPGAISKPVPASAQRARDLRPVDIVAACVEAFFRGDDPAIRAFFTERAQATLSTLATNDNAAYNDIRRALLGDHPLSRLAERGVRVESITTGTGAREMLLRSGTRIVGNIAFRDVTEENLASVELRASLNTEEAQPLVINVILTRDRKLKTWRIVALYAATFGGQTDDVFDLDRLFEVRIAANEAAILPLLDQLQEAQARYALGVGQNRFGTLADLRRAGEITGLTDGQYRGYRIEMLVNNQAVPPTFQIHAVPERYRETGRRSFLMDDSGVLRGADRQGERARLSDPVLKGKDSDSAETD
ncbi:MAG: hypothetical protein SNJ67_10680 [Chloracidobacterium sp.]|uniref:Uncharacterized protein n=1 Tax=Chloracidobacterium validum TaxID=2821543 RepID=A0ABX8BCX1_9BACT|nr:hypothetical protein [Chloracidobacterium validum]QUW03670.1 hypothetical protein J8C06_04330 [Chloracidobacterium validum]